MAKPSLKFTHWVSWSERSSLRGMGLPGIYLLGRFSKPPSGKASPIEKRIIYIGETSRSKLGKRLREFHYTAFDGRGDHPGGRLYRRAYHDEGERLFTAIAPVKGLAGTRRAIFLRYVESKLVWDYARRNGTAPRCNRS